MILSTEGKGCRVAEGTDRPPATVAPCACAQSSLTLMPSARQRLIAACRTASPQVAGTIALVRSLRTASIVAAVMLPDPDPLRRRREWRRRASAIGGGDEVRGVVTTSSPGPIRRRARQLESRDPLPARFRARPQSGRGRHPEAKTSGPVPWLTCPSATRSRPPRSRPRHKRASLLRTRRQVAVVAGRQGLGSERGHANLQQRAAQARRSVRSRFPRRTSP